MINIALKRTRQFHRLKQAELAEKLGISKSFLSEIEGGTKNPTIELLQKYAEVFEIPASSFLLFSESLDSGSSKFRPAARVLKLMDWIAEDFDIEEGSKNLST